MNLLWITDFVAIELASGFIFTEAECEIALTPPGGQVSEWFDRERWDGRAGVMGRRHYQTGVEWIRLS